MLDSGIVELNTYGSVLKENKGVKKTDIKQIIVLTGNSREKLQKLMGPGSGGHTWYRDLKKLS